MINTELPEFLKEYAFFDYMNFCNLHFDEEFSQNDEGGEEPTKAKLLVEIKGLIGS